METWNSRPGGGVPRASSWTCWCNLSFFPTVRHLMLTYEWKSCYHCNQINPVYSKHCHKQCSRSARQTGLRKSFIFTPQPYKVDEKPKKIFLKWTCINTHADCCLHPVAACLCKVHCCCTSHTTAEVLPLATACWRNVHLSWFFNVSALIAEF